MGLLAIVIACSCRWNSPPHPRVDRALRSDEIVGVWRATSASLGDYRAEGLERYATAEAHRLEFKQDGSCSLKTIVGGTTLGQPAEPQMPCRWRIVAQKAGPEVRIDLTVRPDVFVGDSYTVAEEGGRLFLWTYLTDPDARRYGEFEKTE